MEPQRGGPVNNSDLPIVELTCGCDVPDRQPPISVIMTTLNSEPYVSEAIDSILSQTFVDFELVIVDGGSDDGTLEAIKHCTDDRIRLIEKHGLRRSAQLNHAIRHAVGRYVAIMDSDDVALPERLGRQFEFLESHPDVSIVGTWALVEYAEEKRTKNFRPPTHHRDIMRALLTQEDIWFPTTMWKRSLLDAVGGFNVRLERHVDFEWYVRLASCAQFANIPEPLLKKRERRGSLSNIKDPDCDTVLISEIERFAMERIRGVVEPRERAMWHRLLGLAHYYYGSPACSRTHLLLAAKFGGLAHVLPRYLLPLIIFPASVISRLRSERILHRLADAYRAVQRILARREK